MKDNYFPQTFLQSLLLLFISVISGTPLLFLIKKNIISQNIFITLNFILWFLGFISIFYLLNKRRKVNLTNQFNFKINDIVILFILLIISFQFFLYFNIHYYFSSNIAITNRISKFTLLNSLLFAPIFEEIMFRGVILKGYLKHYNPKKAIIISSLLFGFLHFNFTTPIQFIGATFSGFVFGYIFYYTKSVGMTIILHFIYNLMGVLSSILRNNYGNNEIKKISDLYGNYSIYIIGLSFILFIATIYYIYKNKQSIIKQLNATRRLPI